MGYSPESPWPAFVSRQQVTLDEVGNQRPVTIKTNDAFHSPHLSFLAKKRRTLRRPLDSRIVYLQGRNSASGKSARK